MLLPTVKEVNVPSELAQRYNNAYDRMCRADGTEDYEKEADAFDALDEEVCQHVIKEAEKLRDDGYFFDIQEILSISYGGSYVEF